MAHRQTLGRASGLRVHMKENVSRELDFLFFENKFIGITLSGAGGPRAACSLLCLLLHVDLEGLVL